MLDYQIFPFKFLNTIYLGQSLESSLLPENNSLFSVDHGLFSVDHGLFSVDHGVLKNVTY